jgi:hypothetical protein
MRVAASWSSQGFTEGSLQRIKYGRSFFGSAPKHEEVLQLRIEAAKRKIFMIGVSTSYGVGLVVSPSLVLPDPLPH